MRTQGTTTPTDKNLKTSDNTTNNVSTSKHGFAPKSPNVATQYLDGTGNYSIPAGGATLNYAQSAYALLGGVIKAEPINGGLINIAVAVTMVNQQINFIVVYLPTAQTITGVKFAQGIQGVYTANNYNGVALYSYSAGMLTYIDESANTGTIWKGTALTYQTVPLGTTHALSARVYVIASLYCNSAQTTAPTVGGFTPAYSTFITNGDFTNSTKLSSILATQTAMPNPTQAMSGLTITAGMPYFSLY